ncbi:MAG: bifunctional (p)ppGpp synthetase/guanosine-3',5'-bis(diphosphate) 3'-pyrophosphohydrolase [Betaproteobacteria bacterium]|nr:bifunctional (p)ppGpp synthetase/guanosine-3',5'-bis(diphosphate) 3'-pyrophosphohydrolase [Betaproteobacteria bacterium]
MRPPAISETVEVGEPAAELTVSPPFPASVSPDSAPTRSQTAAKSSLPEEKTSPASNASRDLKSHSEFHALSPNNPDYQHFLKRLTYLDFKDIELVAQAARYADRAHANQTRLSGDAYITHPLAVAGTVADWQMDAEAICAALLHDVLEDTGITKSELASHFNLTVTELVDGLSKLDKIEFPSYREAQAENFRKMLFAMARDMRVVLIKLADRHHNLSTMTAVRPDKRRRIARETLEIYAPIANRLGLDKMYRDLQDASFALIYPARARVIARAIAAARGHNTEILNSIQENIQKKMAEVRIEAQIFGREKNLYSVYNKMVEKRCPFSQIHDIHGFRVILRDIPSCYLALGALHALYKPVPGKFKDYISIPKANGYQSLHTTLIGPTGTPVEVQLRTEGMDHVAQEGVAAHWLYKDAEHSGADLQIRTHKWLHSLLEMQSGDSAEFFENVKIDLFPDEVYIFTPKGKIISLPQGATAVDLAYTIHTDVGNRCLAARINHELAPLRTELKNGDLVEIITATRARPTPAWLGYVKTGRARSSIRHFLRTAHNEESAALGERLLNQELHNLGVDPDVIPDSSWKRMAKASGNYSIRGVFTDIGLGKRLAAVAARRLLAFIGHILPQPVHSKALVIHGPEGMAIQIAQCCQPIPGDPIVGSIKKGQGLIVHTHDCRIIRKSRSREPSKWIDVEWDPVPGSLFDAHLSIDVRNTVGILAQIDKAISTANASISNVVMESDPERLLTRMNLTLRVGSRNHLAEVIQNLRRISHIDRINRLRQTE